MIVDWELFDLTIYGELGLINKYYIYICPRDLSYVPCHMYIYLYIFTHETFMIIWSPQTSLKLFASASDPNSPVREVWGVVGGSEGREFKISDKSD